MMSIRWSLFLIYRGVRSTKKGPKTDDLIVGVVDGMTSANWFLNIGQPYRSILPAEEATRNYQKDDLTKYYNIGDTHMESQNCIYVRINNPVTRLFASMIFAISDVEEKLRIFLNKKFASSYLYNKKLHDFGIIYSKEWLILKASIVCGTFFNSFFACFLL